MEYKSKQYKLPKIKGISEEQLEIHFKLYDGYVNHVNQLKKEVDEALKNGNTYVANELQRRFGFEFAGMRNHEQYFDAIVDGPSEMPDSTLKQKLENQFGSFEDFLNRIQEFASTTRGIGWVLLKYDLKQGSFHLVWVGDHELGNVAMPTVLAIDMWEHAYMVDYKPANKKDYVQSYIEAIDWEFVSERFGRMVN